MAVEEGSFGIWTTGQWTPSVASHDSGYYGWPELSLGNPDLHGNIEYYGIMAMAKNKSKQILEWISS